MLKNFKVKTQIDTKRVVDNQAEVATVIANDIAVNLRGAGVPHLDVKVSFEFKLNSDETEEDVAVTVLGAESSSKEQIAMVLNDTFNKWRASGTEWAHIISASKLAVYPAQLSEQISLLEKALSDHIGNSSDDILEAEDVANVIEGTVVHIFLYEWLNNNLPQATIDYLNVGNRFRDLLEALASDEDETAMDVSVELDKAKTFVVQDVIVQNSLATPDAMDEIFDQYDGNFEHYFDSIGLDSMIVATVSDLIEDGVIQTEINYDGTVEHVTQLIHRMFED